LKIGLLFALLGAYAVGLSLIKYISIKTKVRKIKKDESTNQEMIRVSNLIASGSFITLNKQFCTLSLALTILYFFLFAVLSIKIGNSIVLGTLVSMISSALCVYYSMDVSVNANLLTAIECSKGVREGFRSAYSSGRVVGTFLLGISLLSLSLYMYYPIESRTSLLIGLAFGSSIAAIFLRIAGGIFTKAADIGADLVGKVFNEMPEDDPRNPGVIADNIGDNIGDCIGTVADIFSTYMCGLMACDFLSTDFPIFMSIFPSSLACLIAVYVIKGLNCKENITKENIETGSFIIFQTISNMIYLSLVLSIALFLPISFVYSCYINVTLLEVLNTFGSFVIGVLIVAWMLFITNYYTSSSCCPVKNTIKATKKGGVSMNIILGYAYSLESVFVIVSGILILLLTSYSITQSLFSISVSLLTTLGFGCAIMTMDSYGPIVDNAGGILSMSGCEDEARDNSDMLDTVGNATKALTKGYSAAISLITSIIVIMYYAIISNMKFFVFNEMTILGALVGSVVPFFFAGSIIKSVYTVANYILKVISDKIKTLGKTEKIANDYYDSTISSLISKSMMSCVVPIVIIFFPFAIYYIMSILKVLNTFLQTHYMIGVLIGNSAVSLLLGIQMTTGGAAWDNVKKGIEGENKKLIKEKTRELESEIKDFDNHQQSVISEILASDKKATQESLASLQTDLHGLYNIENNKSSQSLVENIINKHNELAALRQISNAAVAGDTFGDPLKDTAGTSLNSMPKIMFLIAILIRIL